MDDGALGLNGPQRVDNPMATFPRRQIADSSNPKKQYGTLKPSISFIPPVALLELAAVMELGAVKYGAHNWVTDPVDFTTYYDAAMRHLMLAFSGEDIDDESKALHVAHAMACCAILTDATRLGNLVDDRPKTGDVAQAIRRLTKTKPVEPPETAYQLPMTAAETQWAARTADDGTSAKIGATNGPPPHR